MWRIFTVVLLHGVPKPKGHHHDVLMSLLKTPVLRDSSTMYAVGRRMEYIRNFSRSNLYKKFCRVEAELAGVDMPSLCFIHVILPVVYHVIYCGIGD